MAPKAPAKTLASRMRGHAAAYLTPFRKRIATTANAIYLKANAAYLEARHRPAIVARERLRLKPFDYWMLFVRVAAIGIIITGITLGAKRTYITLGLSRIFGEEVDADLKLAFPGLFNKSLDVLLVSSLEYMASLLLTIWMAQTSVKQGVTYNDFGLKDELTKPWMTKTTARDRKTMRVEHPKVFLQGVDWLNILGIGQSNIGGEGYPPWDWALGMSASLTFTGLARVVSTVKEDKKGWQHVFHYRTDGDAWKRWTALNTDFARSNGSVETILADDGQVTSVYNWLKETRHQPTSSSIGWTGNLTLILPVLNTVCTPTESSNVEGSIDIRLPAKNVLSEARIAIDFGPVPSLGFTGAICSSVFRHGLYPVNVWIIDRQSPDLSLNHYGDELHQNIVYERANAADFDVANGVGVQARDIMPRLELLVPATGLLPQFLLISRNLQAIDPIVNTDAMGLSIVMGVLLQNIFSTSNKYWSPLPPSLPSRFEEVISSYPIQWQLYGSSPRMNWEWAAVAILVIVLLSFCFGMYQTLRYWMAPGSWVQLDGMIMIAQQSPPLDDIGDEKKAQKRIYSVVKEGSGELVLSSKVG
ncbi:hypothetical protein G6011_01968 [Alternaria panax]|uniref:Uncharacterized protein n=1 Tax=Alternaria panax TaxID=48097 RepID=A0AAD4FER3_9PLEO|nr:hypothetical protein G6011_01968 [Alternaria panax]